MKEDFTPPKTSQLHHIFGKQKGLLQSRGNITPNAPIEVPDWCIIHQELTPKHGSWEPCLGLWELTVCPFYSSAGSMAIFLLLRRPISFFFIRWTRSSSLHYIFALLFPHLLRINLFSPRGQGWLRSARRRPWWRRWRRWKLGLRGFPSFSSSWLAL